MKNTDCGSPANIYQTEDLFAILPLSQCKRIQLLSESSRSSDRFTDELNRTVLMTRLNHRNSIVLCKISINVDVCILV